MAESSEMICLHYTSNTETRFLGKPGFFLQLSCSFARPEGTQKGEEEKEGEGEGKEKACTLVPRLRLTLLTRRRLGMQGHRVGLGGSQNYDFESTG